MAFAQPAQSGLRQASSAVKGSPKTCESCHRSEGVDQPMTPMGRALAPPGISPTLQAHPKLVLQRGSYSYTVETHGKQSTYTVTDGVDTLALPIRWSVGAGAQTWVLEYKGHMYESLLSYYPGITGLDVTTGDESIKPQTLEQAMGRQLTSMDARTCFNCHATHAVVNGSLNLATIKPGVTCEHCHEGSRAHQADAARGKFNTVPPSLGDMTSESMSNFCGQCHRTWEMVVTSRWRGKANVRFQPYRLANSKCFDGADPRIRCTACHDPHQNVARKTASYDAACLACHAAGSGSGGNPSTSGNNAGNESGNEAGDQSGKRLALKPEYTTTMPATEPHSAPSTATSRASIAQASVAPAGMARACPVATSNCASCHMPKVVLPGGGGHLSFTDHEIRIVKKGDTYPN